VYIKKEAISRLENLYGIPCEMAIFQDITEPEMEMLLASQKNGRSHDFTFFIFDEDNQIAVIRKHQHPAGFYRAPSGGAEPDEDLVAAIQREALEETGLSITIVQYILRLKVVFRCNEVNVPWISHVITGHPNTDRLCPIDVKEIKEARWVSWEQLQGPIRNNLINSNLGLFQYRVILTDAVVSLLGEKLIS
jgi:8-oxo-dGTP pyrophosphatase MutT (NUDIX family)